MPLSCIQAEGFVRGEIDDGCRRIPGRKTDGDKVGSPEGLLYSCLKARVGGKAEISKESVAKGSSWITKVYVVAQKKTSFCHVHFFNTRRGTVSP